MKIRDLLSEARTGSLQDDVAHAMPAAYVFPDLKNTDPYKQYRYGVAVAAARRMTRDHSHGINPNDDEFAPESAWGENLVVVTYDQDDKRVLDLAAKLVGSGSKRISTTKSEESSDVSTQSPIKPVK